MRLISYTTKPGRAEENRALIGGVFANLAEVMLPDIRYAVIESGEGNFLHLVESIPSSSEAFQALPAFQTFVSGLKERQVAPNVITELRLVGNYGRMIGE
jgi:hypothetical protein